MPSLKLLWGYKMDQSIVLVTWTNKDHPLGISRQITISPDVDPRSLENAEIWQLCYDLGLRIYGSMSWEILINNSHTCHQTETQVRASRLYEKLADILLADSEAMESLHELYEIAHDNVNHYYD